ncbi:MAG: hypothetical protein JXA82_14500 [Sedimentisphaerales bacterium]|nr:hypothetical protein [Sedimentisphaerales bacterium]
MKTIIKQGATEPRLIAHEPIKKNRVVMAGILVLLMGGMWVRVFWKSAAGPGKAGAAPNSSVDPLKTSADLQARSEYVGLPFTSGRHDQLGVDVFSTDNWDGPWNTPPLEPVADPIPVDDTESQVRQILSRMVVEGIMINGTVSETMIQYEGKYFLVQERQTFRIKQADRTFMFTVESIVRNRVTVAWETVKYEMKMSEPVTGD